MTLAELEVYVLKMENRLATVERVLNNVQVAINNLASLEQLRQINLIRQKDINTLQQDIEDLRNELELVKGEVFK